MRSLSLTSTKNKEHISLIHKTLSLVVLGGCASFPPNFSVSIYYDLFLRRTKPDPVEQLLRSMQRPKMEHHTIFHYSLEKKGSNQRGRRMFSFRRSGIMRSWNKRTEYSSLCSHINAADVSTDYWSGKCQLFFPFFPFQEFKFSFESQKKREQNHTTI